MMKMAMKQMFHSIPQKDMSQTLNEFVDALSNQDTTEENPKKSDRKTKSIKRIIMCVCLNGGGDEKVGDKPCLGLCLCV